MTADIDRDEVVAQLLSMLETPPPPSEFFARFWRRVDEQRGVENKAAPSSQPSSDVPVRAEAAMVPSTALLRHVRTVAEVVVVALGGSSEEADIIAEELVAYVDFSWKSLRLDVLARDLRLWERHLIRETHRRWLAHLYGVRRRWAAPLGESVARVRVLTFAAAINFEPEDQDLFDNIYVHGFSVAETAVMFGLDHEELTGRLRQMWALARRTFVPGSDSGHRGERDRRP